uniref:Venom toxin n=1 Tax=Hemiscorpius lepturus TaxID=520031 RepID=A0A1L4BJ66_HEMLE|nr:venom toxin [Hemiscorpius lepturus]
MLRLVLLSTLVVSIYSLSCPCWRERDKTKFCGPPPTDCPLGTTHDACGCCTVCFKVQGEVCGGPWNVRGVCGEGLYCKKEVVVEEGFDQYDGVCEPKE